MNNKYTQDDISKNFNYNQAYMEYLHRNNNKIMNYNDNTDTVTIFSTRDKDNSYEIKYFPKKSELILVVTNLHNAFPRETITLSNNNFRHGVTTSMKSCNSCKRYNCKCHEEYGIEISCKGNKGEPGRNGLKGDPGLKGQKGDNNIITGKGDKGQNGPRGLKGRIGNKGQKGDSSPSNKGETGSKGDNGDKGDKGEQGDNGNKGDKGMQGKGFKYRCNYDPCKVYYYNDVVTVNTYCCNSIYVYTCKTKSGPLSKYTNICNVPGWKLMLKTCGKNKCDTSSDSSDGESCIDTCVKQLMCETNYPDIKVSNDNYRNICFPICNSNCLTKNNYLKYTGLWRRNYYYGMGDLAVLDNIIYIATANNNDEIPYNGSLYWDVFINNSVIYQGIWKSQKTYSINSIVTHNEYTYISIDYPPKGTDINNQDYWALLNLNSVNNTNKDNNIIETYNGSDTISSIDIRSNESNNIIKSSNASYYAYVDQDIIISSLNSSHAFDLKFEKIENNINIISEEQYIILFNPGTYKITININLSGINNLTLNGYIYTKNNLNEVKEIIRANNEILFNKTLNNTFQHIFPITTTYPNSKIWLRINWNNQNDIITIKSQKTWIIIEQLH
ncbi:hypothetical protein [Powai lake megavirus]|uniref:Collagen-like protein n=1 Tax=Powai lake megavirus TaxID=1842663 RepID=A0A167RHN1_9VIRU|nr:hypothetical protein QJ849_gp532 [Powai lake megavirus]ANB50694.1 hypothetical protein [Powai lake megavirus]